MDRPIPVPPHHIFNWRKQGLLILRSLLVWMAFWFAVGMIQAAFESHDPKVLIRIAPGVAGFAALLSAFLTVALVIVPLLSWPWARRRYGRRLESGVEQMNDFELDQEIELCDRELGSAPAIRTADLTAWRLWLVARRDTRAGQDVTQTPVHLTLRPSRRKLIMSTACSAPFLVLGFWLVLLAITGGDGGTGIEGFRGPNALWAKIFIGGLMVLVSAVPLIDAFTVRVDLTASDLRKRMWGRSLWSISTDNVSLALDDDGSWQVSDARTQKRIGELNPQHFNNGEFLALIKRLRPAG